MRDPGEAAQPLAHGVAVDPHRQRRGRRRHRVGDVVLADDAELVGGDQRLAVVEDRPLGQRHLALRRRTAAEGDAPPAAAEVGAGERRVVGVVDGEVVVALVGEDAQLRRQVGVEVAVAVEVVGREVEEDAALGGEVRGVLELEAGGLADHRRVGLQPAGQRGERRADVAGDGDRLARRAVDVPEQLDRRRLAVGPGDGEEAIGDRPPGQLELADDVEPALQRGSDHRRLPGHARALDDGSHAIELSNSIRIQGNFDALPRQPCRAVRIAGVDSAHLLPAPGQQTGRSLARARQPDDEERAPRQRRPWLARRGRAHPAIFALGAAASCQYRAAARRLRYLGPSGSAGSSSLRMPTIARRRSSRVSSSAPESSASSASRAASR